MNGPQTAPDSALQPTDAPQTPLGAQLEAEHAAVRERAQEAKERRRLAWSTDHAPKPWSAVMQEEQAAAAVAKELRQHPRPTGFTLNAGGTVRLLATADRVGVMVNGQHVTARAGDLLMVTEATADRLIQLDSARRV